MKTKQIISSYEYVDFLKRSVGVKIWKLIHPADQIIHFYLGEKLIDNLREDLVIGKYMLFVHGQWTYQKDNYTVETSAVLEGEDRRAYMHRTEFFIENLKPHSIKDFIFGKDNDSIQIVFDDSSVMSVSKTKYGLLSLSIYDSSPERVVTAAEHVSMNARGKYEYVKSFD